MKGAVAVFASKRKRRANPIVTAEDLEAPINNLLSAFSTRDLSMVLGILRADMEIQKMDKFHCFCRRAFLGVLPIVDQL